MQPPSILFDSYRECKFVCGHHLHDRHQCVAVFHTRHVHGTIMQPFPLTTKVPTPRGPASSASYLRPAAEVMKTCLQGLAEVANAVAVRRFALISRWPRHGHGFVARAATADWQAAGTARYQGVQAYRKGDLPARLPVQARTLPTCNVSRHKPCWLKLSSRQLQRASVMRGRCGGCSTALLCEAQMSGGVPC